MVGFGLPFAALYLFALVFLLIRLLRATFRPDPNSLIPPIALLIPITGAVLHFMMMDIVLMPTIAWFFHVLLALIPKPAPKTQREKIKFGSVFSVAGLALAAAALGILVGTHPAFRPENLPSAESLRERFRKLPLISTILEAKSIHKAPAEDSVTVTINVQGYHGRPVGWNILSILDNSASMGKTEPPWNSSRLEHGLVFINKLGQDLSPGSKMAITKFVDVGPLKRKSRQIAFRVSRMILPWTSLPWSSDHLHGTLSDPAGENNLCAAIESALPRSFLTLDQTNSGARILLITDATTECFLDPVMEQIKKLTSGGRQLLMDVALIGAKGDWSDQLREASAQTGGVAINMIGPEDFNSSLNNYVNTLKEPVLEPVIISGDGFSQTVLPGASLDLKPGSYDLELPEIEGLEDSKRNIKGIKVSGGENRVLNILINDDQVTVEK
jgi:hypothetical protein